MISDKEHQGFVAWFRVHAGEEIAHMYEFMLDTCARWETCADYAVNWCASSRTPSLTRRPITSAAFL